MQPQLTQRTCSVLLVLVVTVSLSAYKKPQETSRPGFCKCASAHGASKMCGGSGPAFTCGCEERRYVSDRAAMQQCHM
jgi:hypothetical protein